MKFIIDPLKDVNIGDYRSVFKFAFLPTRVYNHWVWLEKYKSIERFSENRKWEVQGLGIIE